MSISPKSFLHVLILGSASNDKSPGQIPEPETARSFIDAHPKLTVYLYFIDPNHRLREEDLSKFSQLMDAGVPITMISQQFAASDLSKKFKIFPEDMLLLIDYTGVATCEQEWTELLGYKKQWYVWVPGCSSKRLDLAEAWRSAHSWTPHTIYSKVPVPESLSENHKKYLLVELDKLLLYSRVLPADEKDPEPPLWLQEKDPLITGSDRQTLICMRKSAESVLYDFMLINGVDMWKNPQKQWATIVRRILGLI